MTEPDDKQIDGTGEPRADRRRWLPVVVKRVLFVLVLFFLGRQAHRLWTDEQFHQVEFDDVGFGWLFLAAAVYLIGCLPSVWFWRRMMMSLGARVRFGETARAYYCGHLGKYVPGKLVVLIIRSALLKPAGVRQSLAALTATFETLLLMATGLAVAIVLSPNLFAAGDSQSLPKWLGWLDGRVQLHPLAGLLVLGLLSPLLARFLTEIAVRMTPAEMLVAGQVYRIPARLVAAGMFAFIVNWSLFGLSLGLTLRSLSAQPFSVADWMVWTAAVAAATVGGFAAVFAPGGLGVRELLLLMVLSRQGIDGRVAIAAALLLRLVWFAAECAAGAILFYALKPAADLPVRQETQP